jgi:hypothetical protein
MLDLAILTLLFLVDKCLREGTGSCCQYDSG